MLAMNPVSTVIDHYNRVPPIHASSHVSSLLAPDNQYAYYQISNAFLNSDLKSTCSSTISQTKLPSKRGRKSSVPPELRDQTRRLKKQNMERRRRACISDKMTALHTLAMSLIGVDPKECQKVEKADILNMCYDVFKGVANIANDEPELRERLSQLRSCVLTDAKPTSLFGDVSQSSAAHLSPKLRSPCPVHMELDGNKENVQFTTPLSKQFAPSGDSGLGRSSYLSSSSSSSGKGRVWTPSCVLSDTTSSNQHLRGLESFDPKLSAFSTPINLSKSSKQASVWRPYLD